MKISEEKKEKISEQILAFLFSVSPKPQFTSHIAREIARDEEFTKKLLKELKKKDLVIDVMKNQEGRTYVKILRWKLSDRAYSVYKQRQ